MKFTSVVDSLFNEDSKNIIFPREAIISGEGRRENIEKMANNRDIYCYANRGWSISIRPYLLPSAEARVTNSNNYPIFRREPLPDATPNMAASRGYVDSKIHLF